MQRTVQHTLQTVSEQLPLLGVTNLMCMRLRQCTREVVHSRFEAFARTFKLRHTLYHRRGNHQSVSAHDEGARCNKQCNIPFMSEQIHLLRVTNLMCMRLRQCAREVVHLRFEEFARTFKLRHTLYHRRGNRQSVSAHDEGA